MMKIFKTTLFVLFVTITPFLLFSLNKGTAINEGKISVSSPVKAPYIDKVAEHDTVLLFFGYAGCVEVCTPFLEELSDFYRLRLSDELRQSVDVVFVNLLSEIDPPQADAFVKAFDADFKGVYLSRQELVKVDREFNLIFSPSLFDRNTINHTDYVYLLKRSEKDEWLLENYYLIHPLNKPLLLEDMLRLLGNKDA